MFCLAPYPSRLLEANQNFGLPRFERVTNIPDLPIIDELIRCIPTIDDAECLIRLEDIFGNSPQDDRIWKGTNDEGDTLLHLASCSSKIRSVQWLMQRSPGLLSQRNASGNTPQEALEACMEEALRTVRDAGKLTALISDDFRGFEDTSITCLALLRGCDIEQASDSKRNRLKYGCTCGECVGGFLSPQLRDMLLHHAEKLSTLSTLPLMATERIGFPRTRSFWSTCLSQLRKASPLGRICGSVSACRGGILRLASEIISFLQRKMLSA
jgi:hypothetical protein